jgi:hypothetical protein
MSIESAEDAVKHLYNQAQGVEYKPSASWTTKKEFTMLYQLKDKPKFVPEELRQIKTA